MNEAAEKPLKKGIHKAPFQGEKNAMSKAQEEIILKTWGYVEGKSESDRTYLGKVGRSAGRVMTKAPPPAWLVT